MNMEIPDSAIIAVVGTMGTGIIAMFKVFKSRWDNSEKRHDECEKKHDVTQGKLLEVATEVGELRGRVALAEEISPKLDEMSKIIKSQKSK